MTRFAMGMLVAVFAASALVALASLLAGRAGAAWAGFVAAAPITPSLAVLGTSALPPQALVSGLPVVAAATTVMAAVLLWQHKLWMPTPALALLLGIPLLLPLTRQVPLVVLFASVAAVCLILDVALPASPRSTEPSGRLPWPVAGFLGGLTFAGLLAAVAAWPAFAPMLAMYPVLLVISLTAVRLSAGPAAALRVCRAALGANVAVATFAAVPALMPSSVSPWMALTAAWGVFALVAATWPSLVRVLRLRMHVSKAQPGAA